jgi:hypothetical protein
VVRDTASSHSDSRQPRAWPAPLRDEPSITPSEREPREINRARMNILEALYAAIPLLTSRQFGQKKEQKKSPAGAGL